MRLSIFRSLLFVSLLITFASCSSDSSDESIEDTNTKYVVNDKYDYSAVELEIVDRINQYRTSQGLNALVTINHISNVAEDHDYYMIENDKLTHALFAQREENLRATVGAVAVGENIAYNYSTAQSVVDAWLASPSHKANIEGNYSHMGISVRENAEGKKYFTNLFIRK
ncbi:CAP domain-containing protein [Flavobacterium sp.]|uniref:CAP domain-containing protein n=1 Tax=Flavobacterium sp. TaxID=239 RepID=UPI0028BD56F6|nr:CAP domain-containing protein [Flavobacterium sp.]